MSYWYDADPEDHRIRMLVVGAVVGALVVGVAWLGQWWFSSRDAEPNQEVVADTRQEPEDRPTAAVSEEPSHLERCQYVYDTQSDPLRTAAASLTQWEVHIGAMNKLVVGAITVGQARQFWNQTRAGAWSKLRRFDTAYQHYDQRVFRCPAPSSNAEATAELAGCHRAVAARGRSVRLATVALDTWRQHVHHMDMLRSGEMTPEEATRLWLQSWRQGDREVRAYRDSARAVGARTC